MEIFNLFKRTNSVMNSLNQLKECGCHEAYFMQKQTWLETCLCVEKCLHLEKYALGK